MRSNWVSSHRRSLSNNWAQFGAPAVTQAGFAIVSTARTMAPSRRRRSRLASETPFVASTMKGMLALRVSGACRIW